jgi:hypothetical protein
MVGPATNGNFDARRLRDLGVFISEANDDIIAPRFTKELEAF